MARIRSRATVSRGTPRRKFVWARVSESGSLAPDTVDRDNLLETFETQYGAQLIGCTVVRIRGIIYTSSSNTGQLMVAAAVVESEPPAPDTPVNAEGPTQRPFADYMLYEPFITSGAASGPQSDTSARMIDVKSARKVEELDERLSLYLQTPSGNAVAVSYHYSLSIGVKLP